MNKDPTVTHFRQSMFTLKITTTLDSSDFKLNQAVSQHLSSFIDYFRDYVKNNYEFGQSVQTLSIQDTNGVSHVINFNFDLSNKRI